jgi:hypothetical protein
MAGVATLAVAEKVVLSADRVCRRTYGGHHRPYVLVCLLALEIRAGLHQGFRVAARGGA